MQKGDLIFVYGTLRKGERADLSANAHQFGVEYIGEDRINGRLYTTGWYPGIKLDDPVDETVFITDTPAVVGDLFRITDDSIVVLLDAYEGYPLLYERQQVPTEGGGTAWVYTYNPDVSEDQRIESGDWQNRKNMIQTKAA